MSLLDHLEELRRRLLRSLAALVIAFFLCWSVAEPIFSFLARPIYRYLPPGQKLVFLGVTEPLILYVKVALLAAIFLASPYLLYQAWCFIAPGLYRRERRAALAFVLSGTLLFLGGGVFAYLVAFPVAVEFLLSLGQELTAAITGPSYLKFLMVVMLGLAVMFELPLVIYFLARLGLVTPRFLLRNFRWAVVIIFTVAAIITPTTDVVTLCLFAVPTLLLYLLGIGVAAVFGQPRDGAG